LPLHPPNKKQEGFGILAWREMPMTGMLVASAAPGFCSLRTPVRGGECDYARRYPRYRGLPERRIVRGSSPSLMAHLMRYRPAIASTRSTMAPASPR
jgi:hypothetical protein